MIKSGGGRNKKSLGQAQDAMHETTSHELWQLSLILVEIAKQVAGNDSNSAGDHNDSEEYQK
jgi:hypothetical protein